MDIPGFSGAQLTRLAPGEFQVTHEAMERLTPQRQVFRVSRKTFPFIGESKIHPTL